ncbi:FAD dependent oxidoreductase [Trichodelitschia bisporula]|uniref:FAD dependent oxidoreductase n=1 Tax=Trichodelitschia bisporula TaxID=703511 RepID=A0A6G1HJP5_9PEZI|nr:FAD dependent oxidoreductase [Trichodelitschia bisporula]
MKEEGQGGRYTNAEAGWVDARGAMEWLRERVEGTGRVKFVVGRVVRLAFAGDTVRGAQLESGDILEADVTILAAGAWSPSLLDLADRVRASGQVLAYIAVEGAEREEVVRKGCVMDVGSWIFSTPPPPSGPGFLKIGRHGHGYTNPTTIPHPESPSQTLSVSLPHTSPHTPHASTPIPAEAHHELRAFLAQAYPSLADRKWSFTRLCWYADTPTGDFLVDWHPRYAGLFVATGGSGHGFKFLPVLGRAVVDCMRGEGGEVGEVWRWREEAVPGVWEHEGERGGVSGMVLGEEMG